MADSLVSPASSSRRSGPTTHAGFSSTVVESAIGAEPRTRISSSTVSPASAVICTESLSSSTPVTRTVACASRRPFEATSVNTYCASTTSESASTSTTSPSVWPPFQKSHGTASPSSAVVSQLHLNCHASAVPSGSSDGVASRTSGQRTPCDAVVPGGKPATAATSGDGATRSTHSAEPVRSGASGSHAVRRSVCTSPAARVSGRRRSCEVAAERSSRASGGPPATDHEKLSATSLGVHVEKRAFPARRSSERRETSFPLAHESMTTIGGAPWLRTTVPAARVDSPPRKLRTAR